MSYDKYRMTKEKLDKALKGNSEGILMSYTVNTMEDKRVRSKCAKI